MKRSIAIIAIVTFLFTTLFEGGNLAFAITLGSGATSSGNVSAQMGQIAEATGPVQSFQTDLFTGRAQTSVPIFTPPGRKNVQPNLNLSYSSSGGNSWLGTGWSLDLGFIQRDVKRGVPNYDSSDKYVFSYQGVYSELVLVGTNEYRAKDEALFLKFQYDSANDKWTVTDKSGTKHYFGETSGSRINYSGKGTFKWALSTVKDTSGNYMSVTYTSDQNELYLSTIEYNGNETQSFAHSHKVEFTIEDRDDDQVSFTSGGRQTTAKRLKEVQVKVKDSGGTYKVSRKYSLTYNTSPSTLRSRLSQVAECGTSNNGTDWACFPEVTFTYQDKPLEFQSFGNFGGVVNDSHVGNKGSFIRNSREASGWTSTWADTIDFDGDGLPDRVQRKQTDGKWVVYKNLKTVFDSALEVQDIATVESVAQGYYPRTVEDGKTRVDSLDLNGDGFVDRVMALGSTNSTWYWQKNLGGTFAASQAVTTITSADSSAGEYRINYTTTGSSSTTHADIIDLNGDGLPDRVMKVPADTDKWKVQFGSLDSNGVPAFNSTLVDFTGVNIQSGASADLRNIRFYTVNGANYTITGSELIDMNGDGLPDRVMPKSGDVTKWQVQFNNGSSFEAVEDWGPIENTSGSEYERMRVVNSSGLSLVDLVDINSDGLADRVVYNNSTSWFVQYNKGTGFQSSQTITGIENPTSNSNYNYMRMAEPSTGDQGMDLMDVNGDGLIDRVISEEGASSWYVQKGKGPYPDLLSKIENGRGGKTTITYTQSTGFDNKDTNGINRLPFVVHVVTQVKQEDGMGNNYLTNYSYKGGMYDGTSDGNGYPKREFRGFREVTVTDSIGTKTIHTFGQTDDLKGKLLTKEVKDSSGNLFTKEITTWDKTNPYTGVTFVFVQEQKTQIYDGDETYKETKQTFTYDSYGNLASTTEYGDTGVSGDERKTTNDYVYNTTDYILSTLKQTTLYDADYSTVRAQRYFYYDGATSISTAPTKGLLTKEEEWLNAAGCTTPQTGCSTSPTTVMTYDSYGNIATITDARGYVTTNTYETTYRLFLTQISNAASQTRSFTYDPWIAQILTSTDQNSQVTTTNYDALGRVTKVISPEDSSSEPTQEFIYDLSTVPNKTTTKIKTSKPGDTYTYLTVYSFVDGLGREIQKRSPAEDSNKQVISGGVEFDSRGQVSKQYVPYFADTSSSYVATDTSKPKATFTYDAVGRRTRTDYPDGTNSQVTFSDFVKTTTDQKGIQLRYTNDGYGRLTKVEEFNSGATYTTTYEYDVLNNLKKTTDNSSNETTITYDSLSRKTQMVDPDMGTWSYVYDKNDNLTSQTDAKSQVISFTYDNLNRVTLKDLPAGETDVTYNYDSAPSGFSGQTGYWVGRLAKVTDASGTHEFKYDKQGRVVSDKKTVDSVGYQFDRTYDSMGRVRTLTYPDTEVVTYTYNGFGDIETISGLKSGNTTDYIKEANYNASGQMTFAKYGNNVTSDYTYNSNTLRLSNILTKKPDGTTKLQDLSYTFDNVGNVTHISDIVNSMTQDFTYDDLNRLISATGSAYGTKSYAYSAIGNMTTKGNLTLTYGNTSHDHAVSQVSWSSGQGPSYCPSSPCSYTYDANGNMTARANDTLTYDSENRLKEITAYEGTTSTQNYTLKPGWNVVSFTYLPDNKAVSNVLSTLVYGTDYDQVSTWDSASSTWKHWVNDSDFNDFTEFQRGKTYEIYNKTQSDKTFSVTGKSSGPDISHSIVSGDNFISPAVKTATNVSTVLSGLTLGTHYSDVKRFNATSQTWESYAGSAFTQFEPGKGYNIIGLTTANFSYGNTQQTTTMVYDSTGSRVKKTAGGVTTVYLGKDYEIEGSVTTKHVFLGDRRISTKKSDGALQYIHTDHINSSNIITDSNGDQAGLLEYDPYGETVTQTGSADPKHKYTGQERDDSSHLYYYGARYYDPQIGRFITADPTVQHPSDPQDLNRYAYARNNPIKFTDPTGLGFFSWLKKIFSAIVGIVVGVAVTIVTGNPALGFSAGVAAYRATETLLSGGSLKESITAGFNGFGEGADILKNPMRAVSLLNDPTTDRLTQSGRRAMLGLLRIAGLDPIAAKIVSKQLESALTSGNRSYGQINQDTAASINQLSQDLANFFEPLSDLARSYDEGFWRGYNNVMDDPLNRAIDQFATGESLAGGIDIGRGISLGDALTITNYVQAVGYGFVEGTKQVVIDHPLNAVIQRSAADLKSSLNEQRLTVKENIYFLTRARYTFDEASETRTPTRKAS